jgi:hypothetical protein
MQLGMSKWYTPAWQMEKERTESKKLVSYSQTHSMGWANGETGEMGKMKIKQYLPFSCETSFMKWRHKACVLKLQIRVDYEDNNAPHSNN